MCDAEVLTYLAGARMSRELAQTIFDGRDESTVYSPSRDPQVFEAYKHLGQVAWEYWMSRGAQDAVDEYLIRRKQR